VWDKLPAGHNCRYVYPGGITKPKKITCYDDADNEFTQVGVLQRERVPY